MSSRDQILSAIQQNKPQSVALPVLPSFDAAIDKIALFRQMVEIGGGTTILIEAEALLNSIILQLHPTATSIASTVPYFIGTIEFQAIQQPHELETVDLAIIPSALAVAENGALWITEQDCLHRVLPFITQHLVILIKSDAIVENMHQAYQKIKLHETGFGVFIAGPSKTADIEQSLVIGAQGARSLTVLLLNSIS